MNKDNLPKWETKLSSCKRRVLMTDLIASAIQHVTSNDLDDISAFNYRFIYKSKMHNPQVEQIH
jgi:hypothetical protein